MGKFDEVGGLVRRLIGELAEDPDIYRHFGVVDAANKHSMPMASVIQRFANPPPVGTEVGMVKPYELIRRVSYPDGLGSRAAARTDDSPWQRRYSGEMIPLYSRPADMIGSGSLGRRLSVTDADTGNVLSVMDVASESPDALRVLIHEARHATQQPWLNDQRALRSISSYNAPGINGRSLTDESRRYLARPDELFAHLSEVGDDFVRKEGRLLQSDYDADMAMDMLEAGDAMPRLHPLAKQLYGGAYRANPAARKHIARVLMKYFAVPAVVATGAAAVDAQSR